MIQEDALSFILHIGLILYLIKIVTTSTFMLLVKRRTNLAGQIEGKNDLICFPFAKIKSREPV